MDWQLPPGQWGMFNGLSGPRFWPTDPGPISPAYATPTAIDLWLIEVVYETVAEGSLCKKCGAQLGRGLALTPLTWYDTDSWRVRVQTRCRGWRRHRHRAEVTQTWNDLQIGRFHQV